MRKIIFPPVHEADENGLLAIGGDLEVDTLLTAYKQSIFPWPLSKEYPLTWFSPDPRGVILFSDLHIPKSLKKFLKKKIYNVTFNQHFEKIIKRCCNIKRKGETETWITHEMIQSYINLFHKGHAFSVEVWEKNQIVGGMYGVCIGNFFAGESMFHEKTNASKVAIISLIEHLKSHQVTFLDTQMTTPVTEMLGASEISREKYLYLLAKCNFNKDRSQFFA